MIEETGDPADADEPGVPFARSYDAFKHSAGVALLSLGGVFAFADGDGVQFARAQLVVILTFIGVAGVTSVLMTGMLATLEVKPEPRATVARRIRIAQMIIGFSLFGGLGGFTFNFVNALFR